MSFQGDVGGIGLGELLQSLSRSNREGILTLKEKSGLYSTIGIQGGLIFLLPDWDEDGEIWRQRARRAWADDQDHRVDGLRMSEIAKAHRTETLYQMLDSEGVHFRFEPGAFKNESSSKPSSQGLPGEERVQTPSVHCPGSAVEFLLLEYARIQDESQDADVHALPGDLAVPRALDRDGAASDRVLQECTGTSSMGEIADRLGLPSRQARQLLGLHHKHGVLRFAQPRELLVLFEKELRHGRFSRAAARISAWCESAVPGPISAEDAVLIGKEWDTTRLPAMLHSMKASVARTLMRRLDLAIGDPYTSVVHWTEMLRIFPKDPITKLRLISWQQKDTGAPDLPSIRDLLDHAKAFRDDHHPARSAPLLRSAASRLPNTTAERSQLGACMLQAGLISEGLPWIFEAARTLIESGDADNAIATLRLAVETVPGSREARKLLAQAKANSARGRSIRRNAFIALGIAILFGSIALVQFKMELDHDRKVAEIENMIGNPVEALRLLDDYFPASPDPQIITLRNHINDRRASMETTARTVWDDLYREAQLEATLGDPLLGLQRALDLPPPPKLVLSNDPFPLVSDLFNGLAARLESEIKALGPPAEGEAAQIQTEQRLASLVDDLQAYTAKKQVGAELDEFNQRLADLLEVITGRVERRARMREERIQQEKLDEQDLIVGAARAHANAGDWERAVSSYERLLNSSDEDREKLSRLLAKEIDDARAKAEALIEATSLCTAGKHAEAKALLEPLFEEQTKRYPMPWTLDSFPHGARVKFPDGTVRSTPVVLESGFGEPLELRLELKGYETRVVEIDQPANQSIDLSREPEFNWRSDKPIEALPVANGTNYIFADRSGRIARLAENGEASWDRKLETLGGIARAPVFLPDKPGSLLLLTEDGDAWILDAESGKAQGPWSIDTPPASGPVAGSRGVTAYFADGRMLLWRDRIKPTPVAGDEAPLLMSERDLENYRTGSTRGFKILRRKERQGQEQLTSDWNDYVAEIQDGRVFVHRPGLENKGFKVLLQGNWEYVAWEAPYGSIPSGRLWVSDGFGLRSFRP